MTFSASRISVFLWQTIPGRKGEILWVCSVRKLVFSAALRWYAEAFEASDKGIHLQRMQEKTNPFARMDYTSKDNAQLMMDTLAQQAADFGASFDGAENRFQSAERSFNSWDLGSYRVQYRCNTKLGAFQMISEKFSSYEHIPVFYFDMMIPYQFTDDNKDLSDLRNREIIDVNAEYVSVQEDKDMDGNITLCTMIIPYNDICIREIRLSGNVSSEILLMTSKKAR